MEEDAGNSAQNAGLCLQVRVLPLAPTRNNKETPMVQPRYRPQSVRQVICSICERPLEIEAHYQYSGQHVLCAIHLTLSYCLRLLASCDREIVTTRRVDVAVLRDAHEALGSAINAHERAIGTGGHVDS